MPDVPHLDWSKLMPKQTYTTKTYQQPTYARKAKKSKKPKVKDKSIWRDEYNNRQHLNSIMREI